MAEVHKRAAARRDLVVNYAYLTNEAGPEIAERFLMQAEASFLDLSRHPRMGVELKVNRPRVQGIRKWAVKGFENFLIFYFPRRNGVSIARVLHSSQDWRDRLGMHLASSSFWPADLAPLLP